MNKKYKKVLFDLDNTLVDDDKSRRYAIEQILIEKDGTASEEKIEKFLYSESKFWKDRAEGKIKEPYVFKNKTEKTEWLRTQRFIRFFKNISYEEGKKINEKYIDYLGEKIVPIINAQEIIKYLYRNQYEIYIITNGPKRIVNEKLIKIDIEKYIKDICCSEEAGHMKPHKSFFDYFFRKLNIYEKSDMIIIGDDLGKDILGGIENGIDTCWFNIKRINNDTKIKPNYEIKDLIELKQLL